MSNWRQVHWLVQKVPADNNESVPTFDDLLEKFSKTWNDVQKEWDSLLDGEEEVFTDEVYHISFFLPSFSLITDCNLISLFSFISFISI